jgi:hypothetical protein
MRIIRLTEAQVAEIEKLNLLNSFNGDMINPLSDDKGYFLIEGVLSYPAANNLLKNNVIEDIQDEIIN